MKLDCLSGPPAPCDLLVFGAHPDDAELQCGGTLAKSSALGKKTVVVDVTEGELSSNGSVEGRREERKAASEILGLENRVQMRRPDGGLSLDTELVSELVDVIRAFSPKVIVGPPPHCRHPDHQALHDALKQAHFFCGLKKYRQEIPVVERPLHLKVLEVAQEEPDLLIDISDYWEVRQQALLAYSSQFGISEGQEATFINSGFLETLERRYRDFGERVGVKYAEPFLSTRPPHVNLPTDLVN
jgi:bacillithiol biosynthesis deacetylase BshB1